MGNTSQCVSEKCCCSSSEIDGEIKADSKVVALPGFPPAAESGDFNEPGLLQAMHIPEPQESRKHVDDSKCQTCGSSAGGCVCVAEKNLELGSFCASVGGTQMPDSKTCAACGGAGCFQCSDVSTVECSKEHTLSSDIDDLTCHFCGGKGCGSCVRADDANACLACGGAGCGKCTTKQIHGTGCLLCGGTGCGRCVRMDNQAACLFCGGAGCGKCSIICPECGGRGCGSCVRADCADACLACGGAGCGKCLAARA